MTLREAEQKKIRERIAEFHEYVEELGVEKAKNIILGSTAYKAVKKYVNEYQGEKI